MQVNISLSIYLIISILTSSIVSPALGDSLYKTVDQNGVLHYSSKPSKPGDKPAVLAPIMRGENKLPNSQLISCKDHGDADCTSGPDKDGSVICTDGFRDSAQRFNFVCSAPKLQISEVTPVTADGSFSVIIRNKKSIASLKTEVVVKFPDGSDKKLEGPESIEGFGVAEFKFTPTSREVSVSGKSLNEEVNVGFKPGLEHVTVTCANCP